MALDPSVITAGIQRQPPGMTLGDWAGLAKTAQDISASKSQQAYTEQATANAAASNPGIVAQSQMTSRQAAAQQWLQDHGKDYITTDDNGNKSVDSKKMAVDMAGAGFPDYANGLYQHYLANATTEISNQDSRYSFVKKVADDRAALLSALPPGPAQNEAARRQAGFLDNLGTIPGTNVPIGTGTTGIFYAKTPDGKPILDPNGNPAVDNTMVQSIKTATIPANTQEQIRQQNQMNHSSPEANDPNSSQSKAAQALAIQLGYAKKDDPAQSDSYWYNNRPDFVAALKSNAPSQTWQDKNKDNALTHLATASTVYDPLISATASMPAGISIQQHLLNLFKNNVNDPNYQAIMAKIALAQKDDPTLDPTKMDGPSLAARAQVDRDYHINMSKYYATNSGPQPTNSTSGGIPSAGNTGGQGGVQPPQPAPAPGGNVKVNYTGNDPASFRAQLVDAVKAGKVPQEALDDFDRQYPQSNPVSKVEPPAAPTYKASVPAPANATAPKVANGYDLDRQRQRAKDAIQKGKNPDAVRKAFKDATGQDLGF
jgi:hypothetical protein